MTEAQRRARVIIRERLLATGERADAIRRDAEAEFGFDPFSVVVSGLPDSGLLDFLLRSASNGPDSIRAAGFRQLGEYVGRDRTIALWIWDRRGLGGAMGVTATVDFFRTLAVAWLGSGGGTRV